MQPKPLGRRCASPCHRCGSCTNPHSALGSSFKKIRLLLSRQGHYLLLEHRNHRTQSSGLHSSSKKEMFRETLLAQGLLSAQTRGHPREHLSPSLGLLLAQGTSSQGRRARVPPGGRRAGGGPGSYCGGTSLPDRARDTHTDEIVALKKVRMDKEKDGELGGAAARLALKWEGIGRCKLPELPEWCMHDGQRRLVSRGLESGPAGLPWTSPAHHPSSLASAPLSRVQFIPFICPLPPAG